MILISFLLDALIGDPVYSWHPVRVMGNAVSAAERLIRRLLPKTPAGEFCGGAMLWLLITLIFGGGAFAAFWAAYKLCPALGIAGEIFVCTQLLAARSLRDESMRVYRDLANGDINAARKSVSMIVGRDTETLDEEGITKAAVETVAENASDGIGAPLFWAMLFGAPGMMLYKAVNTMDSMLGYRNERYEYFGKFAARADDAFNYIPARLTAFAMVLAAALCRCDAKGALGILIRDGKKSKSPNSAKCEAVTAGALGIKLLGDAYYFGRLCKKPTIGDGTRPIEPEDIIRANRLMYTASAICALAAQGVRIALFALFGGFYG